MSSIRDFIYLETAFRCVNCSGRLTKYKDELGNIYYVCDDCKSKYFATKKPRGRFIIDIGVMIAVLLFFMSNYTDEYPLADYIVAWFILMGIAVLLMIIATIISHYVFDEINLIEDTDNKEKGKFTGSLADFLLRRNQTLCPICYARKALVSKKGKDGGVYYHCLSCNKLFVESKNYNIFSISFLAIIGIILFGLSHFIKGFWLIIIFTTVFFLYYVVIWLLYKYKDFDFYRQMSAAERNRKVL